MNNLLESIESIKIATKIKLMPDWRITSVALSIWGISSGSELTVSIIGIFWASIVFTMIARHFDFPNRYRRQSKYFFAVYFACMSSLIAMPVMAQAETACAEQGLFTQVGVFFTTTFGEVALGQTTGGLSSLLCQVLGIFIAVLLFLFLGAAGFATYQVSFNNQPLTTVVTPLMGFVTFALLATGIITVFIGNGTGAGGGPVFGPGL